MHPLLSHRLEIDPADPNALRSIPAAGGVYLLASETDQPILLAFAENIRRAITHRLTTPEEGTRTKRADLSAISQRVYWAETFSPFETQWIHWRVARELYPKSYREMIAFPPAWFLRVDPAAAHPRFTAAAELRDDGARYFGPFAAQRDVGAWIEMLEDAFDLCRYHHVLELAPRGDRCAYYDMGKCPAPCDGTISMDAYRKMIANAAEFTVGRCDSRLAELRDAMQDASAALEFEKAAGIRRTLDRAESLQHGMEYEFVADVSACRWLVVQRAGKPRRDPAKTLIRPYYVGGEDVVSGEAASLSAIDSTLPAWFAAAPRILDRPAATRPASETISLVARFLFQREKAPGIFIRLDRGHDPAEWVDRIRAAFAKDTKTTQPNLFESDPD